MSLTDTETLRALLTGHGFHFSRTMGQNFLIADWVPRRIAERAGLGPGVGVTEIGPGVGCLTQQLADRAERVLALELDEALRPVLAETMGGYPNVEILFQDALETDIAALVAEKQPGLSHVLCANLPYNITTPLLTALMEARCFQRLTVMVQREAAKRLCALPGDPDYNAFSVFVRWFTEPEMLFDVSPDCFMPQPKVTSTVLSLVPRSTPAAEVADEKCFLRVVRAAFALRRKTLSNALGSAFGALDKAQIARALETAGLDPRVRGEALGIGEFARVSNELSALLTQQ